MESEWPEMDWETFVCVGTDCRGGCEVCWTDA